VFGVNPAKYHVILIQADVVDLVGDAACLADFALQSSLSSCLDLELKDSEHGHELSRRRCRASLSGFGITCLSSNRQSIVVFARILTPHSCQNATSKEATHHVPTT
jgi:hypothetical protein